MSFEMPVIPEVCAEFSGVGAPHAGADELPRRPELVLPQGLAQQRRDVPVSDLKRRGF